VLVASLATVGCSTASDTSAASAGTSTTGGAAGVSSGGMAGGVANTSGSSAGGAAGTGGSLSTSGAGGTGGSSSTGGAGGTGGGSGGASPSAVTTLSDTKTLGSLTPDEGMQLCNDTFAYFGTATPKPVACKWAGLAYAASSSSPTEEKLRQNCSGHETACQDTVPWAMNSGCSPLPATCQATVAAYSTCIKAEISAFTQKVNSLPGCDTLTSQTTAGVFDAMSAALPAECDALTNMCPELTLPNPTY
jgi:hypothetical protein